MLDLKQLFNWRAEIWEPFKWKSYEGFNLEHCFPQPPPLNLPNPLHFDSGEIFILARSNHVFCNLEKMGSLEKVTISKPIYMTRQVFCKCRPEKGESIHTRGWFRWGPKSQGPSHLRLIGAISTIESMGVGTYHFTWGPKYDMDAYMTTFFGGEVKDLC